ncbi:MAG: transposase [Chloroflexota bacterium]
MTRPEPPSGALLTYLHALGAEMDVGFLRETLRVMLQVLMEMEVRAAIDASPYERNDSRRAYRNGYREHVWQSALGEIPLRIPKLRKGTYYPSFIDSLEEAEQVLLALVQDAYLQGVSNPQVEETLKRLGVAPAHPSQISELSSQLDEMVYEFRERRLDHDYPSLWIDVLNLNIQRAGRAAQFALALAVGIQADGTREILGFEVTRYAEGRPFWKAFLDHLLERGLEGVEVILSDNFEGLKPALRDSLPGTEWQPRREYAETFAQTFVSAVSPQVWVDTSMPNSNSIVSALSNGWSELMPVYTAYGQIDLLYEADEFLVTRLAGLLLMKVQAEWSRQAHMLAV